ncbi:MAG: RtcB family protein [Epulopiscium sp.]|nr:RtcB family protein [Candidatus Epulonipiscium sp.]
MKIIQGKYTEAIIYTNQLEKEAADQILELCNQPFAKGSKIRIMPDVHAGKGCVIGFTANLGEKVIPNIVGVDIGCGMLTVSLGKVPISMERLDQIIRKHIPAGQNVHEGRLRQFPKLRDMFCYRELNNTKRIERSIGTLGGGNHFIEINEDSQGHRYLVIHSGSRNLGNQVAHLYQKLAIDLCSGKEDYYIQREELITSYKKEGKRKLIQRALKELDKKYENLSPKYPEDLCYLSGDYRNRYLHDMNICQNYAIENRETMATIILEQLFGNTLAEYSYFHTIHNYIDMDNQIVRKGAISAHEGEKVLIPMNMRDGSILAVGKGNPEWNESAPHGAGRLMSRTTAKQNITLEEFQESMVGIWTSSISEQTIDESPMAYKPMDEVLKHTKETIEIIDIIKPIYNFKANS